MRRWCKIDSVGWSIPIVAMVIVAVVLSACAAPDRDPVAIAGTPAQFSPSGQDILPDQWWQSFDDDALNAVMVRAFVGNLSLRATWDRLTQAEASARRAGAPLYPSLGTNGNVRVTDAGGGGTGGPNQTRYSLSGAASYELDLWGGLRSTARAAAFDARASAAQLRTSAITLSAQVAQTWYAVAERQARIALLQQQLAANEQVLGLVNLRFRAGQASVPDVLRQQQLLESNKGELVRARGELDVLTHSLAVLLGKPPKTDIMAGGSVLVTPPALPATGIPADLVRRRPDLEQAFLKVRAADERVSAAIAERYPSLTFSLTAETAGGSSDLFTNWFGTLISQLALPIIDGGSRRAEVVRNQAILSESLNLYELSVLQAFQEVEDALAQERQNLGVLASLEAQLDVASQVVVQLRRRFTQGASDYLDVLNALISQQSLERQVLSAKLNVIGARIELARALAGGWDMARPDARVAIAEER